MATNGTDENLIKLPTVSPVLIADDDPPTRMLLRAAIAQWGYTVREAQDGEEAWEILQAPNAPRLLVVDWLMPKLDGLELCLKIHQELSYRPYTILLTQMAGTTNIIKGLEAGADEFLAKPFNMAELRSRLSVGNRIIKYEHTLADKNDLLNQYRSKIAYLAKEYQSLLNEIESMAMSEADPRLKQQFTVLAERIRLLNKEQ